MRRTLEIAEENLGADHPEVATNLTNLGALFADQERYDEAEPLLRRTVEIREATLPPEHPDRGKALADLGRVFGGAGRLEARLGD